jgi:hypothetical protein
MVVYCELTRAYEEAERPGILELPLESYPPPKLLRYRHPPDPDRSPLPNLTVRGGLPVEAKQHKIAYGFGNRRTDPDSRKPSTRPIDIFYTLYRISPYQDSS